MKKLSISIFALLAIIFAVGSAFTSFESTTYKVYGNKQNVWGSTQPQPGDVTTEGQFVQNILASEFDDASELDALQSQLCDPDDVICFVILKDQDQTLSIAAVRDGDFRE
jgi:hypothetical protein